MFDFDVRKLLSLFRRQFLGLIVVLLGFTGLAYKLWEVHQAQAAEAKFLVSERTSINDQKVAFEKEKAAVAVEQAKRDLELQKREFLVGRAEEDVTKRLNELVGRELEVSKATEQINVGRRLLSSEQLAVAAEERIQKLMSEFSDLGVNLDDNHYCMTGEVQRRYYTASSKFSEISSLIKANLLSGKYRDFINQNQPRNKWYGCGRGW
jgi:cell division protein FtsI/penicillin-binding protein 2